MKKLLLMLAVLATAGFVACKKDIKEVIDELLTFYVEDTQNFDIPASTLSLPGVPKEALLYQELELPPGGYEVTSASQEEFKKQNTAVSLVKDVTLDKLTLRILEPQNSSFKFLKSIKVMMAVEGGEEEEVAYLEDIPDNVGNYIELNSRNKKLDKYLKAEKYKVKTKVVFDEVIEEDLKLETLFRFKVTADPL